MTSFSRRFRQRLLQAAGLSALTAPTLFAACGGEVVVQGPGSGGSGASGSSSSSGETSGGGYGITVTATVNGSTGSTMASSVGVGSTGSGVGGGQPLTSVCFEGMPNGCPSTANAPQIYGECTPEFMFIQEWVSGPLPGPNGECCYGVIAPISCGEGRPYLEDAAAVLAPLRGHADWSGQPAASTLEPHDAAELSEAWLETARHEHASVAAFARVALELMALGAPPHLVDAAHAAARDEVEHARLAFALAARFAQAPVGPGPLPLGDAVPLRCDLASMAAATVAEGCVGETLAVALAQAQLETATDPQVVAALRTIVEDEMRHAELAWQTVTWALKVGGRDVRDAVADAFAQARNRRLDVVTSEQPVLQDHGRLSARAAERAQRQALAEVILPCAAALLTEAPATHPPATTRVLTSELAPKTPRAPSS